MFLAKGVKLVFVRHVDSMFTNLKIVILTFNFSLKIFCLQIQIIEIMFIE